MGDASALTGCSFMTRGGGPEYTFARLDIVQANHPAQTLPAQHSSCAPTYHLKARTCVKLFLLVASALLYLVALTLPALHGGGDSVGGLVILLFGWMQVFDGQCIAWMSNPLFFIAWLCYFLKLYRMSSGLMLSACLIGLDTFRATKFAKNEAGHEVLIDHVGAAFYVWELSFLALLAVVLLRLSESRRQVAPG